MEAAAKTRAELLEIGRRLALQIGRADPDGECTADDVQQSLQRLGYSSNELGNAAGSLFPRKQWVFTGEWRASGRVSNHGHQNRVWRLRECE